MRVLFTFLVLAPFFISATSQSRNDVIIQKFTEGIISISDGELSAYSPISSFNKIALEKATKSVVITKDNIASLIVEARSYKHCIITVGTHTIAKITDLNKTIMSGSWGSRLPYGEGYVQKGTLNLKQDYINNIIGIPDSQRRMMFLFK